ncbi:MAG: HGGxSTG domain-containing protein [Janthinobacterium lividum]
MKTWIEVSASLTPWKQRKERKRIAAKLLEMLAEKLCMGLSTRDLPALVCGAMTKRRQSRCIRACRTGEIRCYLHGGRSTGARTPDGKARIEAGRKACEENRKVREETNAR